MKPYPHRVLLIFTAVWVVVSPFVWVRFHSWAVGCPYVELLPRYWPDILVSAASAVLLPAAWHRKSWAVWGLLGAALSLPLFELTAFGPAPGTWIISMVLLVFTALGTRSPTDGPVPETKQLALRVLLVPVYALAALGTAAAYLYFAVGTLAGFDGVTKGRYFLGAVLSILCVLAAFALWRVWLIGGRLWRYGAYANASPKDRSYDAAGLACAAAAFVGFVAIAKPIYRVEDTWIFGVLLAPATCLAAVAFFWNRRRASPADMHDPARTATRLQLADLPGLVCGTVIGLLGVRYVVPRPVSGWGPCELTTFYPLYPDLWPVERPIVFDACDDSAVSLAMISGVLALVCLVAGAFAAAIGRNANAARGARAAAIVVGFVLAKLALQSSDTPDAPYYGWVESAIAGLLVVLGAGWLGCVGGMRGVRWTRRRVP